MSAATLAAVAADAPVQRVGRSDEIVSAETLADTLAAETLALLADLTADEREAIASIRQKAEARQAASAQLAPVNAARRVAIDAETAQERRFIDAWIEKVAPENPDRALIAQLFHTGFKTGVIEIFLAGIEPAPIRWASRQSAKTDADRK